MAQDSASSRSDAYWYGHLGYGTIAGEQRFGGVSVGFGRRIERDTLGLDVLVFRGQAKLFGTLPDLDEIGGVYSHAQSASLMTVKAMYFARPRARTTVYVGAGGGWRILSFGRVFAIPDELRSASDVDIDERWHGHGPEAEISVGYAFARAVTSTRFFLQADVTLPFFTAKRYSDRRVVSGNRHPPLVIVSLGVGW